MRKETSTIKDQKQLTDAQIIKNRSLDDLKRYEKTMTDNFNGIAKLQSYRSIVKELEQILEYGDRDLPELRESILEKYTRLTEIIDDELFEWRKDVRFFRKGIKNLRKKYNMRDRRRSPSLFEN